MSNDDTHTVLMHAPKDSKRLVSQPDCCEIRVKPLLLSDKSAL